ncbi:MAG: hypothetical protein NTV36_02345 [Candidatus Staskawiczbacteria bacterium]|nr:hypothetical protein [Candidatus Staskawiczbacteria bacterium]
MIRYLKIYIFIILAVFCFFPLKTLSKVAPANDEGYVQSMPFGVPKPSPEDLKVINNSDYQSSIPEKQNSNRANVVDQNQPQTKAKEAKILFSVVTFFWIVAIIIFAFILFLLRPKKV